MRVTSGGVDVELVDGRIVDGTHALVTVGQVPNSAELGLENAGVKIGSWGEVHAGVLQTELR